MMTQDEKTQFETDYENARQYNDAGVPDPDFDRDYAPFEDADYDDLPPLFDVFLREMGYDDDGFRENGKFMAEYSCASPEKREIFDRMSIHMTGWSIATLLSKAIVVKKYRDAAEAAEETEEEPEV